MEDTTLNRLICHKCKAPYIEKSITVMDEKIVVRIPSCNCRPDNYEADRQYYQRRELLHDSEIPRRHWKDNLSDWRDIFVSQRRVGKITAKQFVNNYLAEYDPKQPKSMLMTGPRGTGKTRLQFYVSTQIIKRHLQYVHYTTASEMYAAFRETENRQRVIETAIACDVLLLDDLGESSIEDWNKKYLYVIVNSRYQKQRPILTNSMRKMSELINDKYIGEHIISRIVEMSGKWYAEIESDKDMRREL